MLSLLNKALSVNPKSAPDEPSQEPGSKVSTSKHSKTPRIGGERESQSGSTTTTTTPTPASSSHYFWAQLLPVGGERSLAVLATALNGAVLHEHYLPFLPPAAIGIHFPPQITVTAEMLMTAWWAEADENSKVDLESYTSTF